MAALVGTKGTLFWETGLLAAATAVGTHVSFALLFFMKSFLVGAPVKDLNSGLSILVFTDYWLLICGARKGAGGTCLAESGAKSC